MSLIAPFMPACVRCLLTKMEQNEALWATPGIPYTPIGICKTL